MAQLLNAPDDKTIVWTRGTTESINMVAQCYARPRLQPGDEIIASVAEHHANLVPADGRPTNWSQSGEIAA